MTHVTRPKNRRACRTATGFLLCVALLLGVASQATAQQKDKKNKKEIKRINSYHRSISKVLNLKEEHVMLMLFNPQFK